MNKTTWLIPIYLIVSVECFDSIPSRRSKNRLSSTNSGPMTLAALRNFPNLAETFSFLTNKQIKNSNDKTAGIVTAFIDAYNRGEIHSAVSYITDDCVWDDTAFSKPWIGINAFERQLGLQCDARYPAVEVEDIISQGNKVAVRFRTGRRGVAIFWLKENKIYNVFWTQESALKGGEGSLQTLNAVSKVLERTGYKPSMSTQNDVKQPRSATAAERYFDAWNRRDMDAAVELFSDNVSYDDTAFPEPFVGKDKLRQHLIKCAKVFPSTFRFVVEDVMEGGDSLVARWHVENLDEQLPFTRGCSFYTLNTKGLIAEGIDFVEPGPLKTGGLDLFVTSIKQKFTDEPLRLIPALSWFAYMYVVFFSDGILPGANALALEQRTWEEVRDLSLNFFLVSPLLNLPFAPVLHPVLEGVFNLLLSWAALFAGFLSDDRKDKPNLVPMLPTVIGMQFLTSAFLLPYLALRSNEKRDNVKLSDLSTVAQVCESRLLGPTMALVGGGSIIWGLLARHSDFGGIAERWTSFVDLLSIDRVGSSFLVDLAIFALFQSWLVQDDLKRRGVKPDEVSRLSAVGKYVPFFGMAAYLTFRPGLARDVDEPNT